MTVASDIEGFRRSFREEAHEILVDLEAVLLALSESREDGELVGRVFRALHTIKGSGAMFGFDRLAAFTHDLETAFDQVRNGRLAVTGELVDLTLAALDRMGAMLEAGDGQQEPEAEQAAEILHKLHALTGQPENKGAEPRKPVPAAAAEGQARAWRIRFYPGAEMMRTGADPLLLLRELGQMGRMSVEAGTGSVPPLEELEPERCYLGWEIQLETASGCDALKDVFIFVEDACELAIEPAATAAERTALALAEPRAASGGRRVYDKPDNAASLRVPAAKLDQLVNLVGELVTVQARLGELAARSGDPEVAAVSEEIERLTSALRENSMNVRMLPIRATFEKFRRLVHDLARDLQKDVELTIEGAETELDKTVIDQLSDPLMHLIRNSMDHGIEAPAERAARGKPKTARIHLCARHSGASVLVEVSDDGCGIDAEAVHSRAIERGLVAADKPLTEAEIFAFIFEPGFSTARQVSDVSGRGVGMDVVRQRVDSLHGSVEVESRRGAGAKVTLRLPLTLAIIDGLLVAVADSYFVLPVANILECVELTRAAIERAHGRHLAEVRGELVPYLRLREHFSVSGERPEIEQIMVVETEEGRYGLVVDRVLGDCQTVIKSLGRFYRHVQYVSGATVLGSGGVALILDAQRLVQEVVRTRQAVRRGAPDLRASARQGARDKEARPAGRVGAGEIACARQ